MTRPLSQQSSNEPYKFAAELGSREDADACHRWGRAIVDEWEADRARIAQRLEEFAAWIERDRHEPDKLLCHVASMRREVFDLTPALGRERAS